MCPATEKPRGIGILWISCKWWGWSNGTDKNQKQKNSLGPPNKTRKLPRPATKQFWLRFIRRTTWPGYAGTSTTTESSDCFEYPPKISTFWVGNFFFGKYFFGWLRILAKFSFPPKKIPESKILNPKKSFDHPRQYPIHPLGGKNGATAMKSLWLDVSLLYPSGECSTGCTHNGRRTI